MKLYSLFVAILALVLSVSCTKESLPTPELFSSAEEVKIKTYSNTPAFELTWKLNGGSVDVAKTYIQFSNDKEFITTYAASASGNSYLVTCRDIQKMNAEFGETSDFTLYVRLLVEDKVEGRVAESVYSKKITINVDLP